MLHKIDDFHIKDLKNESHPSVFFIHEDYDLFILRLPFLFKDDLTYKSLAFVLTENEYLFYNKESDVFDNLKDMRGFYHFVNKYIDNVLNTIDYYASQAEQLEDNIYQGSSIKEFNKLWYKYKTDLIRVNRVLSKALETMKLFIKNYKKEDDYLERNFEDLYEHIHRAQRHAEYLLEKLDSIYNFHQNQTNEQINRIIYILTLLSGIFLPLNLIVGFFGMNTSSLPFTQNDGGTINVIILLILSTVLATFITLFMKRK